MFGLSEPGGGLPSPSSITDELMHAIEQQNEELFNTILETREINDRTSRDVINKPWYSHIAEGAYDIGFCDPADVREGHILEIAIRRSNSEEEALRNVEFCLDQGADPRGTVIGRHSVDSLASWSSQHRNLEPLHEALRKDYPTVFKCLIKKVTFLGLNVVERFLLEATKGEKFLIITNILDKWQRDIDLSEAFSFAVRAAKVACIDLFLMRGVPVDKPLRIDVYSPFTRESKLETMTPFTFAVRSSALLDVSSNRQYLKIEDSIKLTHFLIGKGADLSQPDASGKTPLAWICELPDAARNAMLCALIRLGDIDDLNIRVDHYHTLQQKLEGMELSDELHFEVARIRNNHNRSARLSIYSRPSSPATSERSDSTAMSSILSSLTLSSPFGSRSPSPVNGLSTPRRPSLLPSVLMKAPSAIEDDKQVGRQFGLIGGFFNRVMGQTNPRAEDSARSNIEVNPMDSTEFALAVRRFDRDAIDLFLQQGGRVDRVFKMDVYNPVTRELKEETMTPLTYAVRSSALLDGDSKRQGLNIHDSIELAHVLLSKGADLSKLDANGKTPLAWICELPARDRDTMLLVLIRYEHIKDLNIKVGPHFTLGQALEGVELSRELRSAINRIPYTRSINLVAPQCEPLEKVQILLQQERVEYNRMYPSTDAALTKRCNIELLKQIASHLEEEKALPSLDELLEFAHRHLPADEDICTDDMQTRVLAEGRVKNLLEDLDIVPKQGVLSKFGF